MGTAGAERWQVWTWAGHATWAPRLRWGTTAVEEICNCLNGRKRTAVKCHVTRAHPWPRSSQHIFSCVSDAVGGGPYGGKQNTWCTRESVDKKREDLKNTDGLKMLT